jgi:MFS family permease
LLLASKGFKLSDIGIIVAIYPAVWGIGQLFTGALADRFCKRNLLFVGMFLQGVALIAMIYADTMAMFIALSALLGAGTAIVYPTFLAAVSDYTHPEQRPQSIGVFRLWRDLGYAFGAVITGLIADQFGLSAPVLVIGLLTIISAVVVQYRMRCAIQRSIQGFKLSSTH